MLSTPKNVPCSLGKNVYSEFLDVMAYKYQLSLTVLLCCLGSVAALILCKICPLMLKSPIVVINSSLCLLVFYFYSFISIFGYVYVNNCNSLFLYWSCYYFIVSFVFMGFVLKSVFSDMDIATPTFLSFLFPWNTLSILSVSNLVCPSPWRESLL